MIGGSTMFARVKNSGMGEWLQIVETYRDGDRIRQRLILYVGYYDSLENALKLMPRDVGGLRRRATQSARAYENILRGAWSEEQKAWYRQRAERDRRAAETLAAKLEALRTLVKEHPGLIERDRRRAERHRQRVWGSLDRKVGHYIAAYSPTAE
jgi:hypothetical protein